MINGEDRRAVLRSAFSLGAGVGALLTGRAQAQVVNPGTPVLTGVNASAALVTSTGSTTARSLAARFTDTVNVLDYGADPTGVANSTTAFQNAMAAGPCLVPVFQPGTTTRAVYTISNCIVPQGACVIGGVPNYLGYVGGGISSDVNMRPKIQGTNGAVRLFNVDGVSGAVFSGLYLDGFNATAQYTQDGISAGGRGIVVHSCLLYGLRFGLGGAVAGSVQTYPNGSWDSRCIASTFQACITGIGPLTDAWVEICQLTACTNGIQLDSNSSEVNLIANRYEFCGRTGTTPSPNGVAGYGLDINGGGQVHVIGGEFDANGISGINWNAFKCSATGVHFIRNGSNVTSGTTLAANSSHMLFNGGFNITITGCTTLTQTDGTVYSPIAAVHFTGGAGNQNGLQFVGNDLAGYQGSTAGATNTGPNSSNTLWFTGTFPTGGSGATAMVVKLNMGTGTAAQDVDTR